MAWTTPKIDFSSADALTAAFMNAIGDNLAALKILVDAAARRATIASMGNGDIIGDTAIGTMAVSCALYDILDMTTSGYNKAKGDADATMPGVAMCLEVGTGARLYLKKGYIKNTGWSLTKGGFIWVSTATAGGFTQTKPTTTGNRIQCLGYAEETNVWYFDPNTAWGEVT